MQHFRFPSKCNALTNVIIYTRVHYCNGFMRKNNKNKLTLQIATLIYFPP